MRFLPVNLNALLVELDGLDQTLALLDALQREPIAGVEDIVPAARTLLLTYRPSAQSMAGLVQAIAGRRLDARVERGNTLVEIPVHYDGEDLAEVARLLNVTPAEVVRRHQAAEYTVAFTGFAPGFAYLAGGDTGLDVPRRATPRTRVPKGAVALAGLFSAVYPQDSPGGWQLIGRTPLQMWDLGRAAPALLQPGFRVRFVDGAGVSVAAAAAGAGNPKLPVAAAAGPALAVCATGLQTLFQDLGRDGHTGQGVSASGALDRAACRAANRLVGNAPGAACLETVNGGLQLRSRGNTVVAVTGADAPLTLASAGGARWSVPRYAPVALAEGDLLSIGQPVAGTRCYVAARGGFAVPPVLGSCSTDTLARVGPPALAVGDLLALHPATGTVGAPELPPEDLPGTAQDVVLDVVLGPRTDWFTAEAVALLAHQRWQVTPQSNRVGLRLAGATPLARAVAGELPSEGTLSGAIQVPPSGQPVLFLADHPLTGGYPVIGCVAPHHLDRAGQIPVDAWVRFHPIQAFEPVETTP